MQNFKKTISTFFLRIWEFTYSPRAVGGIYLFLILFFGFIYWCFPSFWKEPMSVVTSLYFSVITITTLGYGDIAPVTDGAKFFTAIEALSGILLIGVFLNSLAHTYSERESKLAKQREDERWLPARLVVAKHICLMHQLLFNALRWVINPDHTTDLKSHGFSPNTTQREADAWSKEVALQQLAPHYDELKKMIEYNNVALDSILHPKAISYIVSAKEFISTCKFVVEAYKDKTNGKWQGSFNYHDAVELESIFNEVLKLYPDVSVIESSEHSAPPSADELLALVNLSNDKCTHINLRIIE